MVSSVPEKTDTDHRMIQFLKKDLSSRKRKCYKIKLGKSDRVNPVSPVGLIAVICRAGALFFYGKKQKTASE